MTDDRRDPKTLSRAGGRGRARAPASEGAKTHSTCELEANDRRRLAELAAALGASESFLLGLLVRSAAAERWPLDPVDRPAGDVARLDYRLTAADGATLSRLCREHPQERSPQYRKRGPKVTPRSQMIPALVRAGRARGWGARAWAD
jgi:hypothetical protein